MENTTNTVIVTGASRGIGAGLVEAFLKRGYTVVATSRHITKEAPFAAAANVALVDGDIGDPRTAARIVDTAVGRFGRIDVLINNAGVFIPKSFTEYTTEDFNTLVSTTLAGFLNVSQAGNDPKVVGLVYVAALAPGEGESVASVIKPFPPAPRGGEVHADTEGFLTVTAKGIAEDFAQDLPDKEKQLLTSTQSPTAAAVFGATITTAAWKTKPSWSVISSNDRAVPPELEKAEAEAMKATSITIPSSHVPMLSDPKEVADLIVQAAAKAGSR